MKKNDCFCEYHPLVSFTYFTVVLTFSMLLNHPAIQVISIASGTCYILQCEGRSVFKYILKFCLPVVLITVLVNPFFNHEGITIVAYLPNEKPLTWESIFYGLVAGCLLLSVLVWFANFNRVISSEKFIYLFGRVIPALSLVLSMTLRFVPKFKAQMTIVVEAQRGIGRDVSVGTLWQRTKKAAAILSIMVTWALENAIKTADSMKSRGYGLSKRSTFSIYHFDDRDRLTMTWICFCGLYLICGSIGSVFKFSYFPSIWYADIGAMGLSFYVVFLLLCSTPIYINGREARKWKATVLNM